MTEKDSNNKKAVQKTQMVLDDKTIIQLNIKRDLLLRFLNNVASGGIGIMDDNDTRREFDDMYFDIISRIDDPDINIYAPPLPHMGTFAGDQALIPKHQVLIIHHGTRLLQYLDSIVKTYPGKQESPMPNTQAYVNLERIAQLKAINSTHFDLSKLIKLCEELNICFDRECYYAVGILVRSIIDHISPIFGFATFNEVVNNYKGTKSFINQMEHLNISSRKIADSYLHTQIRKKESITNQTQVNFSNDLDVLLSEIIRVQ